MSLEVQEALASMHRYASALEVAEDLRLSCLGCPASARYYPLGTYLRALEAGPSKLSGSL